VRSIRSHGALNVFFFLNLYLFGGPGSVVGIVTGYELDGPGIESCPDGSWGPPSLLYNWYQVFPGGKERSGCDADPSPPSSALVMKE
jgi:hypothetical protein